jgi:hypothetical protein
LPSEKVVEVEDVREGVGEGGLLLPPAPPPPDRSELVLPTYIELFACAVAVDDESSNMLRQLREPVLRILILNPGSGAF